MVITPAALLFALYENTTTGWPATQEIVALGPTTNGPLCAGIIVGPFNLMPLRPNATSFQAAVRLSAGSVATKHTEGARWCSCRGAHKSGWDSL